VPGYCAERIPSGRLRPEPTVGAKIDPWCGQAGDTNLTSLSPAARFQSPGSYPKFLGLKLFETHLRFERNDPLFGTTSPNQSLS
jgi:hypothetical protein